MICMRLKPSMIRVLGAVSALNILSDGCFSVRNEVWLCLDINPKTKPIIRIRLRTKKIKKAKNP